MELKHTNCWIAKFRRFGSIVENRKANTMALSNAYLMTSKHLEGILAAIRNAQAPEKFSIKFLESLGFISTNDRLIIGVLKALGLLDEASVPTQRYFEFLDDTQSKSVLAQGMREAYADLFRVNNKANEMSEAEVKNKLKTLLQGSKSENVLRLMAMTFAALCKSADFSKIAAAPKQEKENP